MRASVSLPLLLVAGVIGCSAISEDADSSDQAETARHGADDIMTTSETGMQLLQGYNYVFDRKTDGAPCVAYDGPGRVQVSNVTAELSVDYVSSLSNLEEQLGFDAAISAKATAVGGASLTAKYRQSSSKSHSSYTYLMKDSHHYDVTVASPIKMAKQPEKADDFLVQCGESYAKGIRYSNSLYVLMTIDAPSETEARSLATGFTADVSAAAQALANGNASANVTSEAKSTKSKLNVTLTALTIGLNPRDKPETPINLPTSGDSSVVGSTLSSAAQYIAALTKSIATDMASEGPEGVNASRMAVPDRVIRGHYTMAPGFDSSHNPFNDLTPRLGKAADYLSKLVYTKQQLEDVYYDEIQAFLGADDAAKARFNVAPPGLPLANVGDVAKVVQDQEVVFRPTGGSGAAAGNVTSGIRKLLYACSESATKMTEGGAVPLTECSESATRAPEYIAAFDALDGYAAKKRVLPMTYFGGDDSWSSSCDKASAAAGTTLRLADEAQVTALAPAVGADPKACAWYRDSKCGTGQAGTFSSNGAADPRDASHFSCTYDINPFARCAVFCVPPAGVFGVPTLLGRGNP